MGVKNPKDLAIGQRVLVNALSRVGYKDNGTRRVCMTRKVAPFEVFVVGVVRKHLGRYIGTTDEDGGVSYLKVERVIWLYAVRQRIDSPQLLVLAEDLEIVK